jgi:alpha-L-fucosidase
MSLCVIAFDEPSSGQLVIQKRLPILPGDKVFLQHPDATVSQRELEWSIGKAGGLIINVTEDQAKDVRDAWAFKIAYAET